MTVREIIVEYLKAHGCDGLAGEDCGCGIGDIAPCGLSCNSLDCVLAKYRKCNDCEFKNDCDYRKEFGCDSCYYPIDDEQGGSNVPKSREWVYYMMFPDEMPEELAQFISKMRDTMISMRGNSAKTRNLFIENKGGSDDRAKN